MERIKIDQEKNEVVLTFNENFYNQRVIDQAVEDFQKVCEITKDKNFITLKPKETLDINTLGYEFYNYVLGLIKNS